MEKIRLIIGSEDSSSRRGLTAIFSSESTFDVVGSFSLTEAIDRAVRVQPDVVLLDIEGNISEYEQKVHKIKGECPCSLVLSLVGDEQCDLLASLLAQGIDGCIPKGIMRGCLVKAVELVCRAGVLCLPGSAKSKVAFTRTEYSMQGDLTKKYQLDGNEFLTKREMEVLQLMAKNFSNRDIANTLFIGEPTVKTHVSNILRKLKQNNRAQAIVYSFKSGLVPAIMALLFISFYSTFYIV